MDLDKVKKDRKDFLLKYFYFWSNGYMEDHLLSGVTGFCTITL